MRPVNPMLFFVAFILAFTLAVKASAIGDSFGAVSTAMTAAAGDADGIKASLLVILGVIVTVGIAWTIVRAVRQ